MISVKKIRLIKKKYKYFFAVYSVILLFVLVTYFTTSAKYLSTVTKTSDNISIARPIVEIVNDSNAVNIVNGSNVVKYFNVINYENDEVTDVAMDYYIKIVDGNNNVINDVKVYYQVSEDDPNDFVEITKETSGTYSDYFKGISFTTSKKKQGYKLVIEKVADYDKVEVKVVAVQKEVN